MAPTAIEIISIVSSVIAIASIVWKMARWQGHVDDRFERQDEQLADLHKDVRDIKRQIGNLGRRPPRGGGILGAWLALMAATRKDHDG